MKLRTPAAPALSTEMCAVLLGGWRARPPEPCEHGDDVDDLFFDLFETRRIAELWRQHEVSLRDVARKWNWTPRFDGRFYAEYTAEYGAEPRG